jgi:hypothetical protein
MSSGQSDSNSVEAVSVPTGPDAVSFSDDAGDTGAAALTPTAPWSVNASGGNFGPAVYATGDYGDNTCSALTSTPIQLGVADTLSFYSNFDIESGYDKGEVQISDDAGVSWTRVEVDYPNSATQTTDACNLGAGDYFTGSAPTWVEYSGDLSPWANQLVELRFEMSTDGSVTRTLGWTLDDIQISSPSSCSPAALGPAPAPDGSLGTSPLLAENLSDGVGDTLQVSWDASCSAADYQLLFGDLSNVASHVVGGSECSIGTSGSLTWNSVPAGNLFFLIVGTDGAGTESSWGRTSSGAERNGSNASGECAVTTKSTTATCP